MKTKYTYIHFEYHKMDKVWWTCHNSLKNDKLGEVNYYPRWRKWIFDPEMNVIFDSSCLDDISHFMKQLEAEQDTKGGKG